MSALSEAYDYWMHTLAREAGVLSQPARRGWPERRAHKHDLELEREMFADAVAQDQSSEGDAIRGVWSD